MFLASLMLAAQVQAPIYAVPNRIVSRDVPVPMRDGVVLRADVHRPPEGGPFPTLVYRTPYGKADVEKEYTTIDNAVRRGYAVVVQDVRGRYRSEGRFEAYRQEGPDGYDTIEWAAAQEWSNGEIGTFGLSYPGAVQWLAAMESPPHLKAMVPAMTFASPRQFFYSGGVWDLSWAGWVATNIAPDLRVKLGESGPRSESAARSSWRRERRRILEQRPLIELPDFKTIAPWYYDWLSHEPTDPWWDWAELAGRYGRTNAAVLHLSGWHDEAYGPHGATRNHMGLVAARAGEKDPRSALMIGPWVHGVDATAEPRAGQRFFGPGATIDYDGIVLDWMDRWLKRDSTVADPPAPVHVFVMGANEWVAAPSWPLPGIHQDTLYLGYGGTLTRRRPSVIFGGESGSTYISDANHPIYDPYDAAYGAHDFRGFGARYDALTFETEPFDVPVEVIGAIRAEIWLETDVKDVDLFVKVLDVAPDGTAYNLMSPGLELLRASHREPDKGRQLLVPGRPYLLKLDDLLTANRFERGHRLRVHIMSSFMPHFSLNPQTGESERTSGALAPAFVTIRHDLGHPSRLILPVLPYTPD